jgi:hypothetical protein
MDESLEIIATIGTSQISRQQVLEWEARRTRHVLKKLAARLGDRAARELAAESSIESLRTAPLDAQRVALTAMKVALGHAGMYALFKRELSVSERISRAGLAVSRGRTKHAVTRIEVRDYSAARFSQWFNDLTMTNAEAAMIDACPDHYLLRGLPDGRQEVIETTGGSPSVTRFLVDYTQTDSLAIEIDPAYPIQIAGVALLDDGLAIGGVRHQFRERDGSMDALLTVQFPAATPAKLIAEHQWHLACEFGNWMTAAAPFAATHA